MSSINFPPTENREFSQESKNNMVERAEKACYDLLTALQIDPEDPNTRDTPRRMAKMFVYEVFRGRYETPPDLTSFENEKSYDELITVGPIQVKSMCSHHFLPIDGVAFIGVLPNKQGALAGLSKYARIVDHFARRPQIQENLAYDIGEYIYEQMQPNGVGVRIVASHYCTKHRGIEDNGNLMVTTKLFGELRQNMQVKDEFLNESYRLQDRTNI